jgi:protein-S-isoprenylcysteine O-methyltransferase Ste14
MIACYVVSARGEEKLLAAGPKAQEYLALKARTWRLIPFIY